MKRENISVHCACLEAEGGVWSMYMEQRGLSPHQCRQFSCQQPPQRTWDSLSAPSVCPNRTSRRRVGAFLLLDANFRNSSEGAVFNLYFGAHMCKQERVREFQADAKLHAEPHSELDPTTQGS